MSNMLVDSRMLKNCYVLPNESRTGWGKRYCIWPRHAIITLDVKIQSWFRERYLWNSNYNIYMFMGHPIYHHGWVKRNTNIDFHFYQIEEKLANFHQPSLSAFSFCLTYVSLSFWRIGCLSRSSQIRNFSTSWWEEAELFKTVKKIRASELSACLSQLFASLYTCLPFVSVCLSVCLSA